MKRMFEQRSYQKMKSEDETRQEKPIYSKVSGVKQLAQEALHKTSHSTSPGKK